MKYDLEERVARFGEDIISFAGSIKENNVNKSIINQLVRAGTSVGANYMEANQASSKKDFVNKVSICRKESNESKYWLRMISGIISNKDTCKKLWAEAHELVLIFSKIHTNSSIKN